MPNVLALRVPVRLQEVSDNGGRAALYQRIRDRVKQVPGVTAVGVVTHIPLSGSDDDGRLRDRPFEGAVVRAVRELSGGHARYFDSLRIPILQGRDFTDVGRRQVAAGDRRRRDAGASRRFRTSRT